MILLKTAPCICLLFILSSGCVDANNSKNAQSENLLQYRAHKSAPTLENRQRALENFISNPLALNAREKLLEQVEQINDPKSAATFFTVIPLKNNLLHAMVSSYDSEIIKKVCRLAALNKASSQKAALSTNGDSKTPLEHALDRLSKTNNAPIFALLDIMGEDEVKKLPLHQISQITNRSAELAKKTFSILGKDLFNKNTVNIFSTDTNISTNISNLHTILTSANSEAKSVLLDNLSNEEIKNLSTSELGLLVQDLTKESFNKFFDSFGNKFLGKLIKAIFENGDYNLQSTLLERLGDKKSAELPAKYLVGFFRMKNQTVIASGDMKRLSSIYSKMNNNQKTDLLAEIVMHTLSAGYFDKLFDALAEPKNRDNYCNTKNSAGHTALDLMLTAAVNSNRNQSLVINNIAKWYEYGGRVANFKNLSEKQKEILEKVITSSHKK